MSAIKEGQDLQFVWRGQSRLIRPKVYVCAVIYTAFSVFRWTLQEGTSRCTTLCKSTLKSPWLLCVHAYFFTTGHCQKRDKVEIIWYSQCLPRDTKNKRERHSSVGYYRQYGHFLAPLIKC